MTMDSERIRITISPIFLICGLSIIVGFVAGIFVALLEVYFLVYVLPVTIGAGIIFWIKLPNYMKK